MVQIGIGQGQGGLRFLDVVNPLVGQPGRISGGAARRSRGHNSSAQIRRGLDLGFMVVNNMF